MKQISMDVLYQGKKQPNVFINDDQLTNLDLAEIRLAKESIKYFKVKMKYLTKDEDGKYIVWQNEPQLIIPLDRNEGEYWEAKGDFEIITEQEALKLIQKIPVRIELPT